MIDKELLKAWGFTEADYERIKAEELEKLNNPTFDYDSMTLEKAKDVKIKNELNQACNRAILGYFKSLVNGIEYSFSNDAEAQDNFKDGLWALENNHATTVKWTAYDLEGNVVRLDLDLTNLNSVNMDRLNHKNSQIAKYRDELQPQVEAIVVSDTLTEEEAINQVKAITWDVV